MQDNKALVLEAYSALFVEFDREKVASMLAEDYIQHNPGVPTGLAPILEILPVLKESGLTPTIHRVIVEGDLVALHVTYENAQFFGAPTLTAFDIFRVEDGLVAEHWDNLQPPPAETASGRSMTDGPALVTDLDKAASNKAVVAGFIDAVFLGGGLDEAADFIVSDPSAYKQHNPLVPDGLASLGQALTSLAEQGQPWTFSKLHMAIAEGDFVLTVTEGMAGDVPTAFYDLWRLEDGKIVEHWDVISAIPDEMAHDNGKF